MPNLTCNVVNKRQQLSTKLDGLCGLLGIEKTDDNKAVITRVLIAENVSKNFLVEIADLIRDILKEDE
jgi:hypothetical protein